MVKSVIPNPNKIESAPGESAPVSKKIGGTKRAKKAREEMELILTDENHPLFLAKDIEFARRYSVSRHTIYKIRGDLNFIPRSDRLLKKLSRLDTKKYTIKDLSKILGIKYQNIYKTVKENNLKVKTDTPPITSLKKYQLMRKIKNKKPRK